MKPNERKPGYRAYLLRCWESRAGSAWRFSLEDPHTGRRRNFAGLDRLVAALRTDLAGDSEGEEDDASAQASEDAEQ